MNRNLKIVLASIIFVFSFFIPEAFSTDYTNFLTYNISLPKDDWAGAVTTDSLGNIYVASYYAQEKNGKYDFKDWDIMISKYPPFANLRDIAREQQTVDLGVNGRYKRDLPPTDFLWRNSDLKSKGSDYPSDVLVVNELDGSKSKPFLYLVGYTTGELESVGAKKGKIDYFIAKFDGETGRLVWIDQDGSIAENLARGVAVDSMGRIIIAGFTNGKLHGNDNAGGFDQFLIYYDKDGNLLNTLVNGGPTDDYSMDISVDHLDNPYVAGYRENVNEPDPSKTVVSFVSKYEFVGRGTSYGEDADRPVFKSWNIKTGDKDYANDLIIERIGTSDNYNIYVSGVTCIFGCAPMNEDESDADWDYFLAKISDGGEMQWIKRFLTEDVDDARDVGIDEYGNIFITGFTKGDLRTIDNEGKSNLLLMQLDEDGEALDIWQLGSEISTQGVDMVIDKNGNVVLVGTAGGDFEEREGKVFRSKFDSFMTVLKITEERRFRSYMPSR